MPIYNIAISDGQIALFTEEHSSMDAARDSVVRAALLMLLKEHSYESKRVAQCRIEEASTLYESSFNVGLEITDFI